MVFMTIQMRHCVRAAQKGDKLAVEELLEAFMPFLNHQAKRYLIKICHKTSHIEIKT